MASGRRIFGAILFVLATLVTIAVVMALLLKTYGDESNPDIQKIKDAFPDVPVIAGIGLGVVILLLLIALLVGGRKKKDEGFAEVSDPVNDAFLQDAYDASLQEPSGIGLGPNIAVYNLPVVPQMFAAWEKRGKKETTQLYTWPRSVDNAIYSIDNIDISPGYTLRLRTLVAGPVGEEKKDLPINRRKPRTPNIKPESVPEPLRSRLMGGQAATETVTTTTTTVVEEIPATGRPADGRAFLQELEATIAKGPATVQLAAGARAYYDYDGDVADVEAIEGIGAIYGDKLRQAGVYTTSRLCYEDAATLGQRVGVPTKTVQTWQHMAELIKVSGIGPQYAEALARSGLQGIAELKKKSAAAIAGQVNAYLESLDTRVIGASITEARVKGWQKASAKMKKVRLKVPEK